MKTELTWISHAVDQLQSGELSEMQTVKVLKTISQVSKKIADQLFYDFEVRMDTSMNKNITKEIKNDNT